MPVCYLAAGRFKTEHQIEQHPVLRNRLTFEHVPPRLLSGSPVWRGR